MRKKIIVLLCTLLSLLGYAQDSPARVKIQFVALGVPEGIDDLLYRNDGALKKIWVPSSHLPEAISYSGPAEVTLYRRDVNEKGMKTVVPAATFTLPAGSKDVLVFLEHTDPAKGSELLFTAYALGVSTEQVPEKSFWIWNMSNREIVGTLGGKRVAIKKQGRVMVTFEEIQKPKALDAKLMYADDESRASYSSTKWFLQPKQRFIMMLQEDSTKHDRPAIRVQSLKL